MVCLRNTSVDTLHKGDTDDNDDNDDDNNNNNNNNNIVIAAVCIFYFCEKFQYILRESEGYILHLWT
jgi:hypothetical protein